MRTRLRYLPILVFVAVTPAQAPACGFCLSLNGNPLALPHPKAIEIAVATRAGIERGELDPRCLIPTGTLFEGGGGFIALHTAPAPLLVRAWTRKCRGPAQGPGSWTVHFLFVDTEETSALTVRAGAVLFEVGPAAPSDARMVTTRTTMGTLLMGRLRLAAARERGLVYVEGDARADRWLAGEE